MRLETPSLRKIAMMCALTVASLMFCSSAIRLLSRGPDGLIREYGAEIAITHGCQALANVFKTGRFTDKASCTQLFGCGVNTWLFARRDDHNRERRKILTQIHQDAEAAGVLHM